MRLRWKSLTTLGAVMGCGYWLLESLLHAYLFDHVPLRRAIIGEHDPNEIWMRLIILLLMIAFGHVAEKMIANERRIRERMARVDNLVRFLEKVDRRLRSLHSGTSEEGAWNRITAPGLDARFEGNQHAEDDLQNLAHSAFLLSRNLESRLGELYTLLEVTNVLNEGFIVEEILNKVYETFRSILPYDRIGIALLEEEGRVVSSYWARADGIEIQLPVGYREKMAGSSLQKILETRRPRILNDLESYLRTHPNSRSTRRIVAEGLRSSLTCPLISMGKAIGFIFFSSRQPHVYKDVHVEIFQLIATQLATIIEKGLLHERLVREKKTSERLLLNVMPSRILRKLKHDRKNVIELHPDVGVLFADIVGFTELASRASPKELARFLQKTFLHFDALCESYGIEKIKTIGDAYMAISGIAPADPKHLDHLAAFALDIIESSEEIHRPDGEKMQLRIGMHAGPVLAGVLGQKKFAYDIWGDTVNLAARLESSGLPGAIHVSEEVFQRLQGGFHFLPRGKVPIKGKGMLTTYLLQSSNSPREGTSPTDIEGGKNHAPHAISLPTGEEKAQDPSRRS